MVMFESVAKALKKCNLRPNQVGCMSLGALQNLRDRPASWQPLVIKSCTVKVKTPGVGHLYPVEKGRLQRIPIEGSRTEKSILEGFLKADFEDDSVVSGGYPGSELQPVQPYPIIVSNDREPLQIQFKHHIIQPVRNGLLCWCHCSGPGQGALAGMSHFAAQMQEPFALQKHEKGLHDSSYSEKALSLFQKIGCFVRCGSQAPMGKPAA